MPEKSSDFEVYRSPEAELGEAPLKSRATSPRQRFWLSCLWSFIGAPLGLALSMKLGAPGEAFMIAALAAYAVPMFWVMLAHAGRSTGIAMLGRMGVVWFGLSVAMAISATLGVAAGIVLARSLGYQAWLRMVPT